MTYNFRAWHKETKDKIFDCSWVNNGTYAYCSDSRTHRQSQERFFKSLVDNTKLKIKGRKPKYAMAYYSFTPPYVKQIMRWLDGDELTLELLDMEQPSMFGSYKKSVRITKNRASIFISTLKNGEVSQTEPTLKMSIKDFREATEAIRAKAGDPFGDGTGHCIRPAGGAFGSWYDDEQEKLVGPHA
jgi:hypothetical protein